VQQSHPPSRVGQGISPPEGTEQAEGSQADGEVTWHQPIIGRGAEELYALVLVALSPPLLRARLLIGHHPRITACPHCSGRVRGGVRVFFAKPDVEPVVLDVALRLASWMAAGHRDQVRLEEFLAHAEQVLATPLAQLPDPLALRLDVALPA
jgi:hypothetical protein